jgi:prepilin-type N-terminal cleavage/methylation domain-containing protein
MATRRTHRAFTLVELMMVLAISSVIMAAVAVSIRDLARINASRLLITEVQGEGRTGVVRIQEEIREASLGSTTGLVRADTAAGVQDRPAVQIFDNVPGGAAWLDLKPGTDALLVISASARFWDAVSGAFLPVQAQVNAANFDPVGTPLAVTDVAGFQQDQFVLVGSFKAAGWFRIRGVVGMPGAPGQLVLGSLANVLPGEKADVGALVRVATARLYYVNLQDELVAVNLAVPRAPANANELLGREILARGVENLQVDCELDGGGMGFFQGCPAVLAGGDVQAESVASGLGNPRLDATSIGTIRTVALNTVVRSRTPLRDQTGEPPIALGNAAGLLPSGVPDPNAQFARRAYRSVVGVRNTSLGSL